MNLLEFKKNEVEQIKQYDPALLQAGYRKLMLDNFSPQQVSMSQILYLNLYKEKFVQYCYDQKRTMKRRRGYREGWSEGELEEECEAEAGEEKEGGGEGEGGGGREGGSEEEGEGKA